MDNACLLEYDGRRVQFHCSLSTCFSFGGDCRLLYDSGTRYQDSAKVRINLYSECGLCSALFGIDALELS